MSKEEYNYLAMILVTLTILFIIVEALIWFNVLDIPQLGNLNNKLDQLFENPAFVGLVTTFFVGVFSGFMENWSITGETFDPKRFAETFFYYEPLLILFSQWLPVKQAAVMLFVIDILRRIAKRLKGA